MVLIYKTRVCWLVVVILRVEWEYDQGGGLPLIYTNELLVVILSLLTWKMMKVEV